MASAGRPSYFKAAFANLYNLVALGGVGVAAAATGDWWLAGLGLLAEAAWLLLGADSARFRRAVDAREADRARLQEQEATERQAAELPASDRARLQTMRLRCAELKAEAKRNPATAGDFMMQQLDRLDGLVQDYLRLAITAFRARSYLDRSDPRSLNREREQARRQETESRDEAGRDIARQNREILEKRLTVIEELSRYVERARGQMSLIENSVGLLRDQLVALKEPAGVGGELDRIVASVEALREATRSAQALVGDGDGDAAPAAAAVVDGLEDVAVPPALDEAEGEAPRRGTRGRLR